jgi:hypothetical protein
LLRRRLPHLHIPSLQAGLSLLMQCKAEHKDLAVCLRETQLGPILQRSTAQQRTARRSRPDPTLSEYSTPQRVLASA